MRSITHNPDHPTFKPVFGEEPCVHVCPNCQTEHECGNGSRCLAPKAMPCSKRCEHLLDVKIEQIQSGEEVEDDT
jgi:hypothetical protein